MEMVWDIPIVVKPGKNAGVEFSVTQVLAVRMTRMFHAPVEAVTVFKNFRRWMNGLLEKERSLGKLHFTKTGKFHLN